MPPAHPQLQKIVRFISISAVAGFLLTFFISPALWHSLRLIPPAPLFSGAFLPAFLNILLLTCMLLGLLLYTVTGKRWLLAGSLFIMGTLIVFDLNRLQQETWFFFCSFLLLLLFSGEGKGPILLRCLQVLAAGFFVHAGFSKLQPFFNDSIYPWMISGLESNFSGSHFMKMVHEAWYILPLWMLFTGLGMAWRKTEAASLLSGILLCILLIFLHNPFSAARHEFILPFYAFLMVLLGLLLYSRGISTLGDESEEHPKTDSFRTRYPLPVITCMVMFWVLPFLSLPGWWPVNMSFAGYSGRHQLAYLAAEQYVYQNIPVVYGPWVKKFERDRRYMINIEDWCWDELKVPLYPSRPVFVTYKDFFAQYASNPGDVILVISRDRNVEIIQ